MNCKQAFLNFINKISKNINDDNICQLSLLQSSDDGHKIFIFKIFTKCWSDNFLGEILPDEEWLKDTPNQDYVCKLLENNNQIDDFEYSEEKLNFNIVDDKGERIVLEQCIKDDLKLRSFLPETVSGIKLVDIDNSILKSVFNLSQNANGYYVKLYSENKTLEFGVEDEENTITIGEIKDIDTNRYRKWVIEDIDAFKKLSLTWEDDKRVNLSLPNSKDNSYGSLEIMDELWMNFVIFKINLVK